MRSNGRHAYTAPCLDPKARAAAASKARSIPIAAALNASVGFDQRLLPHDVAGSIAHAEMLAAQRRSSRRRRDGDRRRAAPRRGAARGAASCAWDEALEDVHMNVEARLIDEIGDAGRAAAHRAQPQRSGRDRSAALRARVGGAARSTRSTTLRRALVAQARAHVDTLMPGYTHLQRAQPVRLAHHLLAYDAMLARDRGRIADAAHRADESPLGSGALAGDARCRSIASATARALGFDGGHAQLARRGRRSRLRDRAGRRVRARRRSTCRASARSSCCGRRRSSASCGSARRTARAAR